MRRVTEREWSRRRWGTAAIGVALLCTLLAIALRTGEATGQAVGEDCVPTCVILVQVDGLEPKDVTEATTPYLWRLAHPQVQNQPVPGSALSGRSGWIWQAPRGVVSTGVAPATASLLTGAHPEWSGVPANDFYGPSTDAGFTRQRLGADGFGDTPHPSSGADRAIPVSSLAVDSLISVVGDVGGDPAVFLGDPALASLTEADTLGSPHWFPPGNDARSATYQEGQYTGDPRLCPIPRYPDGGARIPAQEPAEENFNPSHCPANDLTTANKAISDLKQSQSAGVDFIFMHLAELGAAKRLAADTDVNQPPLVDESIRPPQPTQALSDMDAAVATFVEQYAQLTPAKWERTVLMLVGSNGYQVTPLANRIPDPKALDEDTPTRDLSDYVADFDGAPAGSLTLVPQGTMATVYYGLGGNGTPEERLPALEAIRTALLTEVNDACLASSEDLPPCIAAVRYVDDSIPDVDKLSVAHPTWKLDARDPDKKGRTGASGDLVIELGRGWAVGRAAGLPYQAGVTGQPITNANTASSGGPQERAVAALINGPSRGDSPGAVRNLDSLGSSQAGVSQIDRYPVSNNEVDPKDNNNPPPVDDARCPSTTTDPGGLACANDPTKVGDDADDDGHEAQPVTVDFAITISALMQLPFETHPQQLQGRLLQEAFLNRLATPCVEDCEPEEIIEEEPPPPPLPPPPPPEVVRPPGFDFFGLMRGLKARVVDARNRPYARARRGALMSRIRLEADFGKPESAVTLTFYRRVSSGKRKSRGRSSRGRRSRGRSSRGRRTRVVRLKPIARFDPFVVKRGHVTMRLRIPKLFKPTYVGITVREIARTPDGKRRLSGGLPCTTLKTQRRVPFRCTGPSRGVILRITDAHRLHKKKKGGPRRAPRRRG